MTGLSTVKSCGRAGVGSESTDRMNFLLTDASAVRARLSDRPDRFDLPEGRPSGGRSAVFDRSRVLVAANMLRGIALGGVSTEWWSSSISRSAELPLSPEPTDTERGRPAYWTVSEA
jgi:hypothetical protein